MNKAIIVLILLAVALISYSVAEGCFKYVGSNKCMICHKTEKQGRQYYIWEESAHARAYLTLALEEARAIAAKFGIEDAQASDKCLACHVTAFGVDDSLKEASFSIEEGVGCEACHGPGSDYRKMSIMKDREKAVAAGLWIANEETCLKCHNDKSPVYEEFNYKESFTEIAHPLASRAEE